MSVLSRSCLPPVSLLSFSYLAPVSLLSFSCTESILARYLLYTGFIVLLSLSALYPLLLP